jgi:hypothetical protein
MFFYWVGATICLPNFFPLSPDVAHEANELLLERERLGRLSRLQR